MEARNHSCRGADQARRKQLGRVAVAVRILAPALALVSMIGVGCSGRGDSLPATDAAGPEDASAPLPDSTVDADAWSPVVDPSALASCGEPMRTYSVVPDLRGCERFLGSIDLTQAILIDARMLSPLRWIDGSLNFFLNVELQSLAGLERLEHVGNLLVHGSMQLPDLTGLGRLRTVDQLFISDNAALSSLAGLESLEEVGETLTIEIAVPHRDTVSLAALEGLMRVSGDVVLANIPRGDVDAFLARVDVTGTVELDGEMIFTGPGAGL